MPSFAEMKSRRGGSSLSQLNTELEKLGGKKNYSDDRIWKPTPDKAGNYTGIIRFLPSVEDEPVPITELYNHGFKVGNRWFIENCPTTLGLDCPVCRANSELWQDGSDASKAIASQRKRRHSFFANILVVNDPANPENNGKVMIYRFGKQIMEKIDAAREPINPDIDPPFNPFDMWEGRNFKVVVKKNSNGFAGYTDSQWLTEEPIADSDEAIEKIWDGVYALKEFVAEDKFMSFDDLQDKFDNVVNNGRSSTRTAEDATENAPQQSGFQESDNMNRLREKRAAQTEAEAAPFEPTESTSPAAPEATEAEGRNLDHYKSLLSD